MLGFRKTPQGKEYCQLNKKVAGSVPSTKNHQGGLHDHEDDSDRKIFALEDSPTCPVQTIRNYLSHLNPVCEFLFQRPRNSKSKKFNSNDSWYCNSLNNMMKDMSKRAGIQPYLSNHCLRASQAMTVKHAILKLARGGQIFSRLQYNFNFNCNVQIHNHYGQSG